jgi:CheY-like chemotaxis protein
MKQHDVILVGEDDENHVLLLKRAFKQSCCLNPVFYLEDGDQVIAYLEGRGKFSNRVEFPLPSLLLLDLKMPNKNGFEVLAWIRGHPTLSVLPVVVLSGSGETSDIKRAYQLGANTFLTKPVDVRDFVQMCAAIKGYWLWLSQVPELARPGELPAGPELAPRLDPKDLGDSGHFVQFYVL